MKPLPSYKKIVFCLTFSFSVLMIIVFSIITSTNIKRETNAFKREQQSKAVLLLNLYELEFKNLLFTNKVKEIIDKLKSLNIENTNISTIKIYNSKGQLLAGNLNESADNNIKLNSLIHKIPENNSDFFMEIDNKLLALRRIKREDVPVGFTVIGIPNFEIRKKTDIMQKQVLFISIISVLFAMALNFLLNHFVLTPLYTFPERTGKTERNNLLTPLEIYKTPHKDSPSPTYNTLLETLYSSLNRLKLSEERYKLALAGANDGIWDWDMREQKLYFSGRWFQILGREEQENEKSFLLWKKLIHPEDRDILETHLKKHIEDRTEYLSCEYRMLHNSGDYIWVLTRGVASRDEQNNCTRIAGSLSDINERKQIEQRLKHNAFYDSLTDLANKTLLLEKLKYSFSVSKKNQDYIFYILYLNYDGFKHVNDTYGHKIGDHLLQAIAKRLKKCIRPTDTLYRLGGDEFVILLDNVKEEQTVIRIADRILAESARKFFLGGHSIFISVSIGICRNQNNITNPENLILNSDMALHNAKKTGKAQYCFFTPQMGRKLQERWSLDNELHTALQEGQLELYYQPIYSVPDKKLYGFEALIRWNHPEKGIIMPDRFIPGAEETGFIVDITTWALEDICKQLAYWNTEVTPENPVLVFLNLSPKDLQENNSILARVGMAVIKTKCNPCWLGLEVTESSFIQNFDTAIKQLTILKEFGILIEVDDFGSQYSSLNYLLELPINGVKIDKSFIKTIHRSPMQQNIVKHIIDMSHDLGNYVIAEGIEEEKDYKILQTLKADYIQGYYFSKPVTVRNALILIKKHAAARNASVVTESSTVERE